MEIDENDSSARAPESIDPAFLVGARRSGSTLLRVMLDSHPEICFPRHFEIELAVQFLGEGPELPTDLQPYYDLLGGTYEFTSKGHTIDATLEFRPLLDSFLRQSLRASGKAVVLAAVHDNFDRLHRIWPEARYIYLLRDGRDVARSRIALGWDGNYWTAAAPWLLAERQWRRLSQLTPADRRLEVKYEQLVADPETELARICEFLGTAYDPAIFDYLESTSYERPDPRLTGRWREQIAEADLRLAEARLGAALAARGYELSGLPALEVTPSDERRLARQTRWARRRADLAQYGLRLFLLDFAARKLGAAKWQRRIRLEIDSRRQASLK